MFEAKKYKSKYARNPKTNEKLLIPEKKLWGLKFQKNGKKKLMKKNKIFIACDTTDLRKIKKILNETKNKNVTFGYKFGLEFLNSKNGRKYISRLKNKIIFGDYKLHDIPNTCVSAIKAIKDLKVIT